MFVCDVVRVCLCEHERSSDSAVNFYRASLILPSPNQFSHTYTHTNTHTQTHKHTHIHTHTNTMIPTYLPVDSRTPIL